MKDSVTRERYRVATELPELIADIDKVSGLTTTAVKQVFNFLDEKEDHTGNAAALFKALRAELNLHT